MKLLIPILLFTFFMGTETALGQFITEPRMDFTKGSITAASTNEIYKAIEKWDKGLSKLYEMLGMERKRRIPKGHCVTAEAVKPHENQLNESLFFIWEEILTALETVAEKQGKPEPTALVPSEKNWPPEAPIVRVPEVDSLDDIKNPVTGLIVRVRSLIPPPGTPPENPYLSYFIYKNGLWNVVPQPAKDFSLLSTIPDTGGAIKVDPMPPVWICDKDLFMNCFICGKHTDLTIRIGWLNCLQTDYWGRVVLVHPECAKKTHEENAK